MKVSLLLCAALMLGLAACAAGESTSAPIPSPRQTITQSTNQPEITSKPQESNDMEEECTMEVLNFEREGKKIYGELYLARR